MAETYTEVSGKHTWRDPTGPWRVLCVLYAIAIAIYLALCIAEATAWTVFAGLFAIEPGAAAMFDQAVITLSSAVLPIYLVCAIATLVLTYRLVANAHAVGAPGSLTGPGMAVAAFIIPFVSLIMPPLVMGQLWRATFTAAGSSRGPGGVIAFWWTAFLIGSFTGTYVLNATGGLFGQTSPPPAQLQNLLAVSAFSFLTRVIAASTLLYIFGALVKHQKRSTAADVFD